MELVQESNALRAHADKELAEAQQKLCAAERTVSSSGSMIEQLEQQLQELRDEVEYLQAELEFRGMEAEKAHKRVQLADKAAALVEHRLASLPDLDLRRLANACYHECVQLRKMLHHAEDKLHHSEVPARHTPSLTHTRVDGGVEWSGGPQLSLSLWHTTLLASASLRNNKLAPAFHPCVFA